MLQHNSTSAKGVTTVAVKTMPREHGEPRRSTRCKGTCFWDQGEMKMVQRKSPPWKTIMGICCARNQHLLHRFKDRARPSTNRDTTASAAESQDACQGETKMSRLANRPSGGGGGGGGSETSPQRVPCFPQLGVQGPLPEARQRDLGSPSAFCLLSPKLPPA